MKKKFLIVVVSFVILFLSINYFNLRITGLVSSDVSVSIKERTIGEVLFNYTYMIDMADVQDIFLEFINTGTTSYTAQMREFIYLYGEGGLILKANYFDSIVSLTPGDRRSFITHFSPPQTGLYYIKVNVPYDARVIETWGVFYVTSIEYPEINITPPTIPAGVGVGGGLLPIRPIIDFIPNITLVLDYPKEIHLRPGKSTLLGIKATNFGNISLHDVRIYISAPNLIDFEVYPKQIASLSVNDSVTFLLSIDTKENIPYGSYPIDFKITCEETEKFGSITMNIVSYYIPPEQEVRERILNYEYLITELEREISSAYSKGVNVTKAEIHLERARINVEAAKEFFNLKNYDKANEKLDEAEEDLKKAVFELANAALEIYIPPAFSPILILIIGIVMGIIFVFILESHKKKKKKRPKLLRAVEEEIET